MTISLIAAITRNNGLGRDGDMLYHIGPDLRRFKALTLGHPLVMGRRTFESLPGGALPGRRNIVVTRNPQFTAPGIETAPSLKKALALCSPTDEVMIIGGGEIYRQTMPLASKLYITRIEDDGAGADTFFPDIDPARWHLADSDGPHTDPRTGVLFTFTTYTLT